MIKRLLLLIIAALWIGGLQAADRAWFFGDIVKIYQKHHIDAWLPFDGYLFEEKRQKIWNFQFFFEYL